MLSLVPALAVWAAVPFSDWFVIADIDAGLLYVLALTSLGVYGVILAGWASNSKYAFLGAMRSAAQIVAYEIAMGFALVGVLMAGAEPEPRRDRARAAGHERRELVLAAAVSAASSSTSSRVSPRRTARRSTSRRASRRSSRASTSSTRASRFGLFFLAEYANMILITALTVVFFFGGWLSPLAGLPGLERHVPRGAELRLARAEDGVLHVLFLWFAPRSRATATTRSCGSAGRC